MPKTLSACITNYFLLEIVLIMDAYEICQCLGEPSFSSMFLSLTSDAKKEIALQGGISTQRTPSLFSTEQRTSFWLKQLWQASKQSRSWGSFLYIWLLQCRRQILIDFLNLLEVKHQDGLTDDDFLTSLPEPFVLAAASRLLENSNHNKKDVAIYLLFLESSYKTKKFESLKLSSLLRVE